MNEGIVFAVIAAIAEGVWVTMHKQASSYIDNLFGAILVSLTAVILGLLLLAPRLGTAIKATSSRGLIYVVLAGVAALAIDYLVLKAYTSGASVTVVGPIVIGGGVAASAIIGVMFGDALTVSGVSGVVLIAVGASILSRA